MAKIEICDICEREVPWDNKNNYKVIVKRRMWFAGNEGMPAKMNVKLALCNMCQEKFVALAIHVRAIEKKARLNWI